MRIFLRAIGSVTLAALILFEVVLAFPVAWWLYMPVAMIFGFALIRRAPLRDQIARLSTLGALWAVVLALYSVDWTSRKPFLRDLARIHVGMSEREVIHVMGRYMQGTGWPAPPGGSSSNAPGTLTDAGSGSHYSTGVSPSGDMTIHDSLVFRHSNSGRFGSDWGIVSLSNGRVVRIEFSPD